MRGRTWTVEAAEAGQRLDKFLAAADRAGSRQPRRRTRWRAAGLRRRRRDGRRGRRASWWPPARSSGCGSIGRGSAATRRRATGAATAWKRSSKTTCSSSSTSQPALLTVPLEAGALKREGGAYVPSVFDQINATPPPCPAGARPLVVHRIDQDTSGRGAVRADVAGPRRAGEAVRANGRRSCVYLALVDGHPHPSMGTWHDSPRLGRGRRAPAGGAARRLRRGRRARATTASSRPSTRRRSWRCG